MNFYLENHTMKNKRNFILAALIISGLLPVHAQAIDWKEIGQSASDQWSRISTRDRIMGGIAVAVITTLSYGIYRLFKAPSNEQLCDAAQNVYTTIHAKYKTLKFVKYPNRMNITQAGYLFELTKHKDLSRIRAINADVSQLTKQLNILHERIAKNQKAGKSDYRMNELAKKIHDFEKKLDRVNAFWNAHAGFFTTHEYLTKLSNTYSQYDYNNPEAVRMQIRGNATAKHGDAYTYPFKTFATELAQNIHNLQERIQDLRAKAQSFADRELIANDYLIMVSQAEPFCQALIYLRDVAANQPEYTKEMKAYEKAERKRAERAAQERAANARAQAEREKADAEREKAEAIRYKARMDYLAKTQQKPATTNVTVVNN